MYLPSGTTFASDCELASNLIPSFRTKLNMISSKERGRVYVEEQAHGGADDRGAEAVGGREEGGGCSARGGRVDRGEPAATGLLCRAAWATGVGLHRQGQLISDGAAGHPSS